MMRYKYCLYILYFFIMLNYFYKLLEVMKGRLSMNIDDLRIFCQVVEEGNFSKVARLNYISQPAITQKMYKLEKTYEVSFFKREAGRITVTENAKKLYPFFKRILRQYEASFHAIEELHEKEQQTIKIGASFTVGEYVLPAICGKFNRQLKTPVRFELIIDNSPSILQALERDVIDIACIESNDKHAFQKTVFSHDKLVPVVSANHPFAKMKTVDLQSFLNDTFVWRETESSMRHLIESHIGTPKQTIELDSIQAIKSTVEANLGVTILPELTIKKEVQLGSLIEIKIPGIQIERQLTIVERHTHFSRQIVNQFKQFLIDSLP